MTLRHAAGRVAWDRIRPACVAQPVALLAILAVGLALRLAGVNRSLWEDEVDSGLFSQRPLSTLFDGVASFDSHPPFYYLTAHVLHYSLGLGTVASLKAPSVLAGVASIVVVYAIASLLMSRTAALVAASLVAISPVAVWYSQAGRMYAMAWLFVLSSYLFLIWSSRSSRWQLQLAGLHAAATALALWTDYSAGLALLPQLMLIALGRRRRLLILSWTLGCAAFVPWLPFLLRQLAVIRGQRFPGLGADLDSWGTVLADLAGIRASYASVGSALPGAVEAVFVGLLVVAAIVVVAASRRDSMQLLATVAGLSLGPLLFAAVFVRAGIVAVLITRVLGIAVFGGALVCGGAIHVVARSRLPGARPVALVSAAILLGCLGAGELKVMREGTNYAQWDRVAAMIARDAKPGDALIYYPMGYKLAVDAYLPDDSRWRTHAAGASPEPDVRLNAQFLSWAAGHDRVWLVYAASPRIRMVEHDTWIRGHGYCRLSGRPDRGMGVIEYGSRSRGQCH